MGADSLISATANVYGTLDQTPNHINYPNSVYDNIKNNMGEGTTTSTTPTTTSSVSSASSSPTSSSGKCSTVSAWSATVSVAVSSSVLSPGLPVVCRRHM